MPEAGAADELAARSAGALSPRATPEPTRMPIAEPTDAIGGTTGDERGVEVTLEVPRILCDCTAGQMSVSLQAETIASALREVARRWPTLATHILDERGAIRQHVLLLHNGKLTKYYKSLEVPLRTGDRLQIVQAVSGG